MRRSAACLLWVLSFGSAAHAVELVVTGLDGASVAGRAVRLAPEIVLATDEGEKSFSWSDVIDVRLAAPAANASAASAATATTVPFGTLQFELADDSVFRGRVTESSSAGFVVALSSGVTARLTLDAVRI